MQINSQLLLILQSMFSSTRVGRVNTRGFLVYVINFQIVQRHRQNINVRVVQISVKYKFIIEHYSKREREIYVYC